MWDRINYPAWADVVPYVAFFLTFCVFFILTIRAIRMKKSRASRLAQLPLESDDQSTSKNIDSNQSSS